MNKIALIGAGFMGSAVARALRQTDPSITIGVVEKDDTRRNTAITELGARDFSADPAEVVSWADLVVLAIKPQDLESAAAALFAGARFTDRSGSESTTPFVSILAGTSLDTLESVLRTDRLIRLMPNLAAEIGKSVTGVTVGSGITDTQRDSILRLLEGVGTLVDIPESRMAAITALSGSGIAFVFEFIDAMAMGAVLEGIPYNQALPAALDVVESAALLLRENGVHPEEMVSRVCSPSGTTVTGIRALARGRMRATVIDALGAAAERSRELEG